MEIPIIGNIIYLETDKWARDAGKRMRGGKAHIESFRVMKENGGTYITTKECPGYEFEWEHVKNHQVDWKEEYKDQWAHS